MSTKLTIELFKEKAGEKHNNLYKYDEVVYVNNSTKVRVWCVKCEKYFEQTPSSHLYGNHGEGVGCPSCGGTGKLTTELFKEKAREKHGNLYEYPDKYINAKVKIRIWCNKCGDYFYQKPDNHINGNKGKGQGCPVCNGIKITNKKLIDNLTMEEDSVDVDGEIQCRCTYCKEYFTPTRRELHNRMNSLSGKLQGECRLYCSDSCKNLCPIYGKSKHHDNPFKPDRSREVQPALKKMVLDHDDYTCQRCGSSEDLHCHHFEGIEVNPIESADIDMCITLCHSCHNKVHSSGQCEVRRKPCKI